MKTSRSRLVGAMLGIALLLVGWAFISAPKHPIALIRVVDASGQPVAGALVTPDGMRTKPGPYQSGHYGWVRSTNGPPPTAAQTDRDGVALVPYPRYVFERIETGQISFSVTHPHFVPDRPFRVVSTAPPAGAPWHIWLSYLVDRVRKRALVAQTDPVALQPGCTVQLSVTDRNTSPNNVQRQNRLFALISNIGARRADFWTNPTPNVLLSRQVAPGPHLVQLVRFDEDGVPSFSDVVPVDAGANQPTELQLEVKAGIVLAGQLDPSIPRPIRRGRVIAHVTPFGTLIKDEPPQWHAWTETKEDGTFRFASLPSGTLEISAICDGYISTNGPGKSSLRHPQRHDMARGDLTVVVGMEPTARLEVTVLSPDRKPVANAKVLTWPNIHYGDWGATIFADCYNTADLLTKPATGRISWAQVPTDFQGTSDSNGLAVLPNLPTDVKQFAVEHADLQLPAIDDGSGRKQREASVTLIPGQTNRISIRLEPRTASQIAHY